MQGERFGGNTLRVFDRSDLRMSNGLPFFEASCLSEIPWIRHGFLTRRKTIEPSPEELSVGGTQGVPREQALRHRRWIATAFGFDPERLVMVKQVHRDGVLIVKEPPPNPSAPLEYDAMITDIPGVMLGIRTADCLPILLADPLRKVIAAVHAGRAGTALRITAKVVKAMEETFGCSPRDLWVALGPSIGFCCYEIDEKAFQSEWDPFSVTCGEGRWRIDLARINIAQLQGAGVLPERIESADLCTRCHSDLFFSYRNEGRRLTGTQLSFIGMKAR